MDNFLFALNKSFENMKLTIDEILYKSEYTEDERKELFYVIGTYLHAALDYAERVTIDGDYTQFVSAFRYVNNSLKHSIEVKELSKHRGGMTFPIHFPLTIPKREIVWSVIDNGKQSQMINYKQILDKKNVIGTCNMLNDILLRCERIVSGE